MNEEKQFLNDFFSNQKSELNAIFIKIFLCMLALQKTTFEAKM